MTISNPLFAARNLTASLQLTLLLLATMAVAIGVLVSATLSGALTEAISSFDLVANGTWTA